MNAPLIGQMCCFDIKQQFDALTTIGIDKLAFLKKKIGIHCTVNFYRGFTGVLQGFMCTGVLKYRDPLYKPCTAKSL